MMAQLQTANAKIQKQRIVLMARQNAAAIEAAAQLAMLKFYNEALYLMLNRLARNAGFGPVGMARSFQSDRSPRSGRDVGSVTNGSCSIVHCTLQVWTSGPADFVNLDRNPQLRCVYGDIGTNVLGD